VISTNTRVSQRSVPAPEVYERANYFQVLYSRTG
jgi:hypothetical protein